tara:strand:- start:801 stop:950 length:150 start_codon:yes stop_codon:yes gene_type:complete
MLLYTEKQLEDCYNVYRIIQVKQNMAFVSLDSFRIMFEQMLEKVYEDII